MTCKVCGSDHLWVKEPIENFGRVAALVITCARARGHDRLVRRMESLREKGLREEKKGGFWARDTFFQFLRMIAEEPADDRMQDTILKWLETNTMSLADEEMEALCGEAMCALSEWTDEEHMSDAEEDWRNFLDVVHGILERKKKLIFG